MNIANRCEGLSRRQFLRTLCLSMLAAVPQKVFAWNNPLAAEPQLPLWIRDEFLRRTLYRIRVNPLPDADGPAGANRSGFRWIEEQREGASWITRGIVNHQADWVRRGWRQLDWGLEHQDDDGGFSCDDAFHSTSFFGEALARACIVDPQAALQSRRENLERVFSWLSMPEIKAQGEKAASLFAHRSFILAAGFGQAAAVTGVNRFADEARAYAEAGMAKQWKDGTNPERGGFDAGYQMIGAAMAFRYLSVLESGDHRAAVEQFVTASVDRELQQVQADGSIDVKDSTRLSIEIGRGGTPKSLPYEEIVESLIYGSQALGRDDWRRFATVIARQRNWIES